MSDLTRHQKAVLAALVEIHTHEKQGVSRVDIGILVGGRYRGIMLKTMYALLELKLAQPDSLEALAFVQEGRCRCGCDRWLPTDVGMKLARTYRVKFSDSIVWVRERAEYRKGNINV
jgi:hypothetical protein